MKYFSIIIIFFLSGCLQRQVCSNFSENINTVLGVRLGQKVSAKIYIMPLSNTYYERNISDKLIKIKILEINGKVVNKQLLAYSEMDGNVTDGIKVGEIYMVECYEKINSIGQPYDWDKCPQQIPYFIDHRIVIKLFNYN